MNLEAAMEKPDKQNFYVQQMKPKEFATRLASMWTWQGHWPESSQAVLRLDAMLLSILSS